MKRKHTTEEETLLMPPEPKAQHTPGPWKLVDEHVRLCVRTDSKHSYAFRHDDRANARLIAAAPELLEALKQASNAINRACNDDEIINQNDNIGLAFSVIHSAIAKATGEA